MTAPTPTVEQLDNIRRLSALIFDSPDRVFMELGLPKDRFTASRISVALEEIKTPNGTPAIGRLTSRLGRLDTVPYIQSVDAVIPEPPAHRISKPLDKPQEDTAAMSQPTEKECTRCKETKALDEFAKQKKGRLGRNSWCKECARVHAREAREAAAKKKAGVVDGSTTATGTSSVEIGDMLVASTGGDGGDRHNDPNAVVAHIEALQREPYKSGLDPLGEVHLGGWQRKEIARLYSPMSLTDELFGGIDLDDPPYSKIEGLRDALIESFVLDGEWSHDGWTTDHAREVWRIVVELIRS